MRWSLVLTCLGGDKSHQQGSPFITTLLRWCIEAVNDWGDIPDASFLSKDRWLPFAVFTRHRLTLNVSPLYSIYFWVLSFFSLSSFRIECMMIYSYYNGKLIILTEWKWTTIYNWMYLFEHAHFNLCLLHCRWKTKKWKSVTYEQINFFLF